MRFLLPCVLLLAAFALRADDAPIDIYPDAPVHGDIVVAVFTHPGGCSDVEEIAFRGGELVISLGKFRAPCFTPAPPQQFAVPVPGLLPGEYELRVRYLNADDQFEDVGRTAFTVAGHVLDDGPMAGVGLPAERTTMWWLPERGGWSVVLFESPDFGVRNTETHRSRLSGLLNSYGPGGEPVWFLLAGEQNATRGCAPAYQIGCREFTVYRFRGQVNGAFDERTAVGTAVLGVRSDPDTMELSLDVEGLAPLDAIEMRRFTTLTRQDIEP